MNGFTVEELALIRIALMMTVDHHTLPESEDMEALNNKIAELPEMNRVLGGEYLTIPQAAERIGITLNSLYQQQRKERIAFESLPVTCAGHQVGTQAMVSVAECDRYVAEVKGMKGKYERKVKA